MKWINRMKEKKGYSLVEVMMGTGVMTVVLAGTFSAVGQGMLMSDGVKSEEVAIQVLQTEMEDLRTLSWEEIDRLPRRSRFDPMEHFSDFPFSNYNCHRIITPVNDSQKEIRVVFSWSPTKGRKTNRREFVSYFTKGGLYDFSYRAL